jgi:imidazolonepropionase-like amidohydrolase
VHLAPLRLDAAWTAGPTNRAHSHPHASATANTIVLSNLRVIHGDGGTPLEHADILIQGDKIIAVGVHGEMHIPASATVTSLAGRTALPGLISNHSHLGLGGAGLGGGFGHAEQSEHHD